MISLCVGRWRLRHRSVVLGLAVAALVTSLPGRLSAQTGEGEVGPAIGSVAPPVTLEDLDGNAVQLLGYVKKGQPALFEFWAAWCENCAALQPQMDEIQKTFGDRVSVVAVAVAVGESVRRVRRHLTDHDPGYPFLWDGDGAAVRAYNASTTSIVVMLDADGRVAYAGVGPRQDLMEAVKNVLGAS